jgi:hypothetical protein
MQLGGLPDPPKPTLAIFLPAATYGQQETLVDIKKPRSVAGLHIKLV